MLTLSPADQAILQKSADKAIANALSGTTVGWSLSRPKNEPDAVAAVVSVGLPDAARAWSPTLRPLGYTLNVVGVFCHGAPHVTFPASGGGQSRCELADLLMVVDEDRGGVAVDRRAVLVQAKVAGHPTKTLSGPDLVQLDLYNRWPPFDFVSKAYAAYSRDFTSSGIPGVLREGRDYGGIDLPPTAVAWEQVDATNPLVAGTGMSLGAAMAAMAVGNYGRRATPSGMDHWSKTIDELLVTTYAAVAGGYAGSPSRGVTTLAYSDGGPGWGANGLILWDGDRPPPEGGWDGDRPEGPATIVHLRFGRGE